MDTWRLPRLAPMPWPQRKSGNGLPGDSLKERLNVHGTGFTGLKKHTGTGYCCREQFSFLYS